MANRFWVGGGSANTWAATSNTNWATSSGGSNNATVPGTSDLAIFDSNSGTGNSVIGASITVQGVDCTGGTGNYAGTITHNTSVTLTINTGAASSLRFSAGMTYTPASTTSQITFSNTSGTAQLTSAGKAFCAIVLNGVGGTVQQQDALSINVVNNSSLTITNGVWDCNGNALTAIVIASNNSNTRSFLLGGTVTVGGGVNVNSTIWNFATTTNLTFTKNSANLVILAPNSAINAGSLIFAGGGLTYNGITFNASTNGTTVNLSNSFTASSLTIGSGWNFFSSVNTILTVTNAFTWTGTQTRPICFFNANGSNSFGVSCASGTCTLAWGALAGFAASGGATFTATNVLDLGGGNSGWSITPPGDSSSTGVAASVWRDTTSGDFTVSGSIGQSLFTGVAPGGTNGLFIAGTNAATSVTTALTANITGNLSGSVGSVTGSVGSVTGAVGSVTGNVGGNVVGSVASVTGAVGSVTGNVGGNVVGSVGSVTGAVGSVTGNVGGNVVGSVGSVVGAVGSVTARVTANSDQVAGSATAATNLSLANLVIGSGTVGAGSTTTSIVTSAYSIAGKSGPRAIIFRDNTTTVNLQGQGVAITSSTGGATPTFTVATLTDAPVSGDTFLVL